LGVDLSVHALHCSYQERLARTLQLLLAHTLLQLVIPIALQVFHSFHWIRRLYQFSSGLIEHQLLHRVDLLHPRRPAVHPHIGWPIFLVC
jgi:hypothetical protein